jgi:hypothetical protein
VGSLDTKQEAAFAYDREARQCGDDKLLNYESIEGCEIKPFLAVWHNTIQAIKHSKITNTRAQQQPTTSKRSEKPNRS